MLSESELSSSYSYQSIEEQGYSTGTDRVTTCHAKRSPIPNNEASDIIDTDTELRPELYHNVDDRRRGVRTSISSLPDQDVYRKTILCILSVVIILERIAYFNIFEIVLIELEVMASTWGNSSNSSSTLLETDAMVFTGLCYFLPVFGGLLTCGFSGRYVSIFVGFILYSAGACIIAIDCPVVSYSTSGQDMDSICRWKLRWLSIPLLLVSIGGALLNVALYPFLVYQATYGMNVHHQIIEQMFAWIYSLFTFGDLLSTVVSQYVTNQTYSPIIASGSLALATITFLSGTKLYKEQTRKRNVLIGIARLLKLRLTKCFRRDNPDAHGEKSRMPLLHRREFDADYIDKESLLTIQQIGRILPVLGVLFVYYSIESQWETHLNPKRASGNTTDRLTPCDSFMKKCQFNIFGHVLVSVFNLLMIFVIYAIVFPMSRRFDKHPSFYQKLGATSVGLVVSLGIGGIIEFVFKEHDISEDGFIIYHIAQGVLMGFSLTVTAVCGYTFSYLESPAGLEDVFIGLFLCACGVGLFLGSSLIYCSHVFVLPKRFYVLGLGVLCLLNFLLIVFLSKKQYLRQSRDAHAEASHSTTDQSATSGSLVAEERVTSHGVNSVKEISGQSGVSYTSVVSW